MKIEKEENIEITLKMTKEEAEWLKENMQNPLHGHSPDEECREDWEMRIIFWDALLEVL